MINRVSRYCKFFFLILFVFTSSNLESQRLPSFKGIFKGEKGRKEMVEFTSKGLFTLGTESDPFGVIDAPEKQVSIKKFYIDKTEVSNKDYRRFVNYVRDSIIREKLARLALDLGLTEEDEGTIGMYAFKNAEPDPESVYEKYVFENYTLFEDDYYESRELNWNVDLKWDPREYVDQYYTEIMDSMYIDRWDKEWTGVRMIDTRDLKYRYKWFDAYAASKNPDKDRSEFVIEEVVPVYPDTLVWLKDFEYSFNNHMFSNYFWHPDYSDHPVVGVTWEQAKAYCNFKTYAYNQNFEKEGTPVFPAFRLPTEAEWEFAARGGDSEKVYPWEGTELLDKSGNFIANFKSEDGYGGDEDVYTSEVGPKKKYHAQNNLFHMAGNVAEWTNSTYNPDSYEFISPLNPNYFDKENPRRVIRGGSWKDIAYFLRANVRDFELKDSARSYIGFRTVIDLLPK